MNWKKDKKGFTLLEILLVIAAIGILAAIVLVSINPTRQIAQVRNAQRRSDINTIYKALEQYLIDNKAYPTTISTTKKDICISPNTPANCISLSELVPTYLAAIPKDPSGGTYQVSINSSNNRVSLETSIKELNQVIAINPPVCPTGYIPVPGNPSLYGTNDFCVMKYEAKAVEISDLTVGLTQPSVNGAIDNNATATTAANERTIASVASGFPIGSITQATALTYCANVGARLISNAEWMTIARNIEGQGVNWTGGTVGNGSLFRGHGDGNGPNGFLYSALEASTDDDPYIGTGNNINNGADQKRTHTLSNGEVVWDLSGNVWEFNSTTINGLDKPNSPNSVDNFGAITSYGSLNYDLIRASDPNWWEPQNIGFYYKGNLDTGNYVFMRGGFFFQYGRAGLYTLSLEMGNNWSDLTAGFRCTAG